MMLFCYLTIIGGNYVFKKLHTYIHKIKSSQNSHKTMSLVSSEILYYDATTQQATNVCYNNVFINPRLDEWFHRYKHACCLFSFFHGIWCKNITFHLYIDIPDADFCFNMKLCGPCAIATPNATNPFNRCCAAHGKQSTKIVTNHQQTVIWLQFDPFSIFPYFSCSHKK